MPKLCSQQQIFSILKLHESFGKTANHSGFILYILENNDNFLYI